MTVRRLELDMGVREYEHWKALNRIRAQERADAERAARLRSRSSPPR